MTSTRITLTLTAILLLALSAPGQNPTYRDWTMASGKKSDVALAVVEQGQAIGNRNAETMVA